ncbi:MAG: transposase, partial [Methylobacter sp.]|nr:transposase [Methylobacter sp.]
FIDINRNQPINLPGNCEGWLDENSLARFVVDLTEQLDTSAIEQAYSGGGSAPYPPKMMLALLFYCYAKGIFSSRKIERATYELIPVLFITGGTHPDHDSINSFRKRFLTQMTALFVQLLQIAQGMGLLKLGDISLDGTKIKANASKHKAMSWDYACKLEAQLRSEVDELNQRAATESGQGQQDINIPEELKRREARLDKINSVKAELERRAAERHAKEQAEYEAKLKEREDKERERGRKLGGVKPQAPEPGPRAKDQVNFTDDESRIMPTAGGGFEQAYNAQASVDITTMLIVGQHVCQNTNDKQEVAPALAVLAELPDDLGHITRAAADSGYFSQSNTQCFETAGIEPYMPTARQHHNPTLDERFPKENEAAKADAVKDNTPVT